MAQDDYIKSLMSNFRPNGHPLQKQGKERKLTVTKQGSTTTLGSGIIPVLEQVRDMKIEGEKKRLIKIDQKHEEILKVMYPVFSVDVTRFINFLLTRFFQDHPELIEEIRKSFKKL
ncbi:hypothetical protein [Pleomorphovibrio marinus]|uniref:hypothetical protein n=1 Tax=Pleomorphovibrio marinus TaxID=2164132 RepID=UPI001E5AC18E|nr:hypothetical protein [Pleomorphovibrio marinus]